MRTLTILACALFFMARPAVAVDSPGVPAVARIRGVVTLAEQADVSPREIGIVDKIAVSEGQQVDAGQLLVQLDDRKAQAELKMSQAKHEAAKAKADDPVNEKYAKAAAAVAKQELQYNEDANRNVPRSVPQAKIDELKLKVVETNLAIEKAVHDRTVAKMEAAVAGAEVDAANVMIELLKVNAPIDGQVIEVRAHKGEAVQPAQPGQPGMIQIVSLDKLWVRGEVSAKDYARSQLANQPVTVEVEVRGHKTTVTGQIDFVAPITNTGGTYQVRAVVKRPKRDASWPLHAGMQAEMIIPLRTAEALP
jgi:multidrug efflux pump subunit AcrA (membrane-fusion protein)